MEEGMKRKILQFCLFTLVVVIILAIGLKLDVDEYKGIAFYYDQGFGGLGIHVIQFITPPQANS